MITESGMTRARQAMWNAILGADVLKRTFVKTFRSNQDLHGLLMQGISVSDCPALVITQADYASNLINYGQEAKAIPFQVQAYFPPDRWDAAELKIEQIIWAVRNQAPSGSSVPYIQAACASVVDVQGVGVKAATLQQSPSLASTINESRPERCILATATIIVSPLSEAFA